MTATRIPPEGLSVWPISQTTAHTQRSGRYLPDSTAHPAKMTPALAARTIAAYSQPGELVMDPMCGIGTTLVEAVHLDRRAVGVELETHWASLAAANLHHARAQNSKGRGLVIRGDASRLGRGLLDDLAGQAALVLTSPPYGPSLHGRLHKRRGWIENYNVTYSDRPDDLARANRTTFLDTLVAILAGCARMLAPGGYLALSVRPYRRGGMVNLPGDLLRIATGQGLRLHARHAALLCGLRDDRLIPRATFFQIAQQRSGNVPRMLIIAHEDLLVFQAPAAPQVGRATQR